MLDHLWNRPVGADCIGERGHRQDGAVVAAELVSQLLARRVELDRSRGNEEHRGERLVPRLNDVARRHETCLKRAAQTLARAVVERREDRDLPDEFLLL